MWNLMVVFIGLKEKTYRYSKGSYSTLGFYSPAWYLVIDRLRNAASSISFVVSVTIEHLQCTTKQQTFPALFSWQFSEFSILELKWNSVSQCRAHRIPHFLILWWAFLEKKKKTCWNMHHNQSDEQPMEKAFKYLRISVVENSTIF